MKIASDGKIIKKALLDFTTRMNSLDDGAIETKKTTMTFRKVEKSGPDRIPNGVNFWHFVIW